MAQVFSSTTYRVSKDYDGKTRKVFPKNCEVCKSVFWSPKHLLLKRRHCSLKCSHSSQARRVELTCAFCKKPFTRAVNKARAPRGSLRFCSRPCKDEAQAIGGVFQQKHADTGVRSYRLRAFKLFGKVCRQCGYDQDERMLDADHVDGDRSNGKKENLQVLCLWCHGLKTRGVEFHPWGHSLVGKTTPLQGVIASSNLAGSTK